MKEQQTQLGSAVSILRRAAGLLDEGQTALRTEVIETCDRLNNPTCRIAVFGPFNYGKSTLLNALLGEKTLPMDLVPTTGAAITVKYGPTHKTRITRTDGAVQVEDGTTGLQAFAVLDEQRRMRADVENVEVFCPHPLLKLGVELIDLPGTDDAIAQNDLVQQALLGADVVIQLLDGRKLMTLAEREHLRDWLLDRGIESVIFVVNFLNLMESCDRQQVSLRLRFLAESFRANLPAGVSNLYQVDALPALRARLKGDAAAAAQTGLAELESALQTMGQQMESGRSIEQAASRIKALADAVVPVLNEQIKRLAEPEVDATEVQKSEIKKKAQELIQQGFEKDLSKLKSWLSAQNLQANYRLGLAAALKADTTQSWLLENLKPAWEMRKDPVVMWVNQASEFFEVDRPADMHIGFETQAIEIEAEQIGTESVVEQSEVREGSGIGPVAIATGLGWILGGPLGAAVLGGTSHLVNESSRSEKATPKPSIDYAAQADIYLSRFSAEALEALEHYTVEARALLQTNVSVPQPRTSAAHISQINLLRSTTQDLLTLAKSLP